MKKTLKIAFCLLMILGRFQSASGQVDSEFWFVVPELSYRNHYGGKPGVLHISTLELEATVTISMPANAWDPLSNPTGFQDIVLEIPGNSAEAVDLSHLIDDVDSPNNNRLENKNLTPDGINNFGLHITATNLINAYWSVDYNSPGAGGADIWTLKGGNALGTLFFTPFQTFYPNRTMLPDAYSAIDIVATQDGTSVTFTLPPGKAASYGLENLQMKAIAPGGTHTVMLNEGQTFSLFPLNKSTAAVDRLAGTKIESNFPIAVTLKDDAVAVGQNQGGADVVGDQLIPVSITGDTYIVPEISNPNHVYVLATEDNTDIYVYDPAGIPVGASPWATLNAGEQALVIVPNGSKFVRITSAPGPYKPFYVFQMGIENNARGGALVPPIGCTGNTQLAFTRAFEDNKFYFFIIVEEGNEDKFLIDGVIQDGGPGNRGIINPGAFMPIAGSGGYMAFFSNSIPSNTLSQGQHLVTNTGGIFHLGILNGFPGGGQGRKINYGYYSDFGNLNVGASVAGTNSHVTRACHGDPVQLYAFGGTVYDWTPDIYLDDATSNMPIAYDLPPGAHAYTAEVSGTCGTGESIDITILVAEPVRSFFRTDVATGCSPLEVTFTDLSEGAWSWRYDMGDGSPAMRYDLDPLTSIPDPPDPFVFSRTYHNTTDEPIEYTVTLLVRNESGCADFFTKTIVVYPEIEAGFTADPIQGCDPVEVAFTNTSTGNTDKWFWEFGDGGSSIEENPIHTYSNLFGPDSEVFNARLVATSPFLCRDTAWQTITVEPYIEALFTFEEPVGCHPHEIEIYNQSFGADRYFWNFGDGTTSETNQLLFNKTFTNTGTEPETYTITLRVENDEGCFDVMERELTVYPDIQAAFTALPGEGCSPLEVEFFNNSTGAAYYHWDFGDGGSSPEENPVHIYERNLTGSSITYDVSLAAISEEMCTDTAWFSVTVHPWLEAAFTVESVTGCDPFDITINNLSAGADYYYWDFGDGTTSTTSDPVISHTYLNNTGATVVYPLTLTVENEEGCTHTLIREITVHPSLTADFLADRLEGCSPLDVAFTNLSVNAATWYWDFGDGASSIEPDPVHTFTNNGTADTVYLVTLITTSGDGLCVKEVSWPIRVHGVSEAAFSVSGGIGCTPSEITFENLSTGGMNHIWDFGDGSTISTAGAETVTHTFVNNSFDEIQDFQVRLTVEHYAGCNSQSTKTVRVYPGISAGFDASSVGDCHPLTVDFNNLSLGVGYWNWDFGDGTSSSLEHPQHTFTNTGTADSVYTVKLIVTAPNNVCMDSFSMDITVHPIIKAGFTVPAALDCSPFDVVIENNSVNGSVFYWDFGNGTDTVTHNTDPFVRRFTNPGFTHRQEFEISLTAENFAGCRSEIRRSITVEPDIAADFTASQVQGCHPLVVDFTNFSEGAAYYSWDFDNGTGSSAAHPSAFFTNFGVTDKTYRVKLVATAGNHVCKDSLFVDITVHPFIRADFNFIENIACSPSAVTFHNASTNGEVFYWDFGDGTGAVTNGMDPVTHTFTNSGFTSVAGFQVTLYAENHAGCPSMITRTVQVYPDVQAAFSVNAIEGCHPLTVNFSNQSNGGHTYLWDFDDGSTSSGFSPSYTFTNFTDAPVTRRVRLTARSRDNCISDTLMDITIHPNPVARFEIDRTIACPPFDLEITNTSLNSADFRWEFGDGNSLVTGSSAPVTHIYENPAGGIVDFNLKLVASSQFGCMDSVWQTVSVYPAAIAGFSSIEEGCSPLTVEFTNQSVRGHTWHWDLGDGITMGVTNPSHTYTNHSVDDSVFTVTLTATTVHGCTDRVSGPVTVYPQPRADFTASPIHQVYPSTTVTLINESNPGYWDFLWETGDGSTMNGKDPVPYEYESWGEYEITLSAWSDHCTATTTRNIRILPPPPVATFDPSIPGCAPHEVRFRNRSEYGTSWLWEFDDGNVSEEFEPVHIFTDDGMYNVRLTASGPGGVDYSYRMVEVYRNPVAMFKVAPELVMLPDQEVRLFNMSEHGVSWLWDFGDGTISDEKSPEHLYTALGVYTITLDVWTGHDCTDRYVLQKAVTVVGQGAIRFPNAFRPDNSGPNGGYYDLAETRNHIFRPVWEGVSEYKLRIYNRWGELLYVSDDVMKGWDGYYQGKMAKQDVYVWKVWGTFTNGKKFVKAGDVTLLR